ncbi:MAG: Gfo/Idh/MocA family oxidoreductase [Candidatus Hydrogenedentes bacterium]|nr:Gfo/Idh/MocA family oxidoreductase [Candidatus Hydrogenedentota bacterium]
MGETLSGATRRDFLKTSAAAGAALTFARTARAQKVKPIRVGLIGCGRRGTGAAHDCISSSPGVQIVAMGDVFDDKVKSAREKLKQDGDAFKVTDETCFTGFDAYKNVIAADVDMVILATPPNFRPDHLQAAVDAGKHVFMEKPGAVDPVGVRKLLKAGEDAGKKKLSVVAGTQRRHQDYYLEIVKRIHDGAIGELVGAQCYWIGNYDYYAPVQQDNLSDMEWQLRNWNYFAWLSGDHIVEQHVHNIDVINWAFQAHPLKAMGIGGRQQRTDPVFGHIYDHFAVEFEYPNGVRVTSMCRQMADSNFSKVEENIVGTKGYANPKQRGIFGENPYKYENQEPPNPYVQEHADLIASIREGKPINEAKGLAESTLTAIMGRLACYTAEEITWDWAMNESKLDLQPENLALGPLPVPPVAVPGQYKLT